MTFPVRRVAAPAILLVTALALSGCFGHSTTSSKPAASASPSATPTALPPLTVRSVVTRVIGDLAPHERDRFGARAGALVQRYFRAAFLDPHRGKAGPRTFPGFTPQARALAVRDHAVLTGAAYAGADRVEPRSGAADVSVLAPHRR